MDNEALLAEVARRLKDKVKPVRAVVFGSRARGDMRGDSDLDLMVVLDHRGTGGQRAWEVGQHLLDIPVPVDLVIYTPEEYADLRDWLSSVAGIAEREGRVLVG